MRWQHCDRWMNPTNVPATTTPSVLTNWLAQNPQITSAMQWILPQVSVTPVTVAWDSWPSAMQQQLLDNFVAYWAWYAGGMTGSDPTPVTDPPPNQFVADPANPNNVETALAPADAQALYVKYLALSFVVELQHQVGWSMLEFDAPSLAELLDARKFFTQYDPYGYVLLGTSVIPAPPLAAATFVSQHGWACHDRKSTIAETVFWMQHLQHFQNHSTDPLGDMLGYWQYAGNAPASRMLAGTTYTGSDTGVPTNLTRWTWGCHGTTGLIKAMLRVLNIPVEEITNGNPSPTVPKTNAFYTSGHATPHFLSEGLWLSHGDDPYFGAYNQILPFPLQSLEIDDATFYGWFPNDRSGTVPIGRNPYDKLWLQWGDSIMLEKRLTDLLTHPTPPDANICTAATTGWTTCSQAEAGGLLGMLDPLLSHYTTMGDFQTDLAKTPLYWSPDDPQYFAPPCDTCVAQVCQQKSTCCTAWNNDCQVLAYQTCQSACIY
jgi:hypothetical protein